MVGMIQEIIKCIDMYGVIAFITLMNEGFFVIRIAADIDIGTIAGINMVTVAGYIRKIRTRLFKSMIQEVPGFC